MAITFNVMQDGQDLIFKLSVTATVTAVGQITNQIALELADLIR